MLAKEQIFRQLDCNQVLQLNTDNGFQIARLFVTDHNNLKMLIEDKKKAKTQIIQKLSMEGFKPVVASEKQGEAIVDDFENHHIGDRQDLNQKTPP